MIETNENLPVAVSAENWDMKELPIVTILGFYGFVLHNVPLHYYAGGLNVSYLPKRHIFDVIFS